jgi:hypothetical protein
MSIARGFVVAGLLWVGLAPLGVAQEASDESARPAYRVLGSDRNFFAIVGKSGEVEWKVPVKGTPHDVSMLADGNILLPADASTIVEMTPAKEIVWQYASKPKEGYTGKVEVHAFQRLDDGLTMIAETGNRRIIEVDRAGKIVHEVPLTVDKPDSHRDTRMARKLANGHYLVCHEGDGMVREYDPTGKVVWSYTIVLDNRPRTNGHDGHGTEVFGAIRLPSGNTLIAAGNNNRVLEVNPEGAIVWKIGHDELPGIRLAWVSTLQLLPNGNVVVGNTHAGPDNPQLFEVTRDKRVVWKFNDFKTFGNDFVASQLLDIKGKVIR